MTMLEISDGSSTPVAPTLMVNQMQRAQHQLEGAVQPLGFVRSELAIPEQATDRHCPARGTKWPENLRRASPV